MKRSRACGRGIFLVPLLTLALTGCGNSGNLLGPIGITTTASGTGRPGTLLNVGFQFQVLRAQTVQLRSAKLIGVPKGLQVVGPVVAVHADQTPTHGVGALWGDVIDPWRTKGLVHPVSDVTLDQQNSDWTLVAVVRSDSAGTYTTKGVSLTYISAGSTYSQALPFRIRLISDPNAPPV